MFITKDRNKLKCPSDFSTGHLSAQIYNYVTNYSQIKKKRFLNSFPMLHMASKPKTSGS